MLKLHSLLVTNDDGPESPYASAFIDALAESGRYEHFSVVLPSEERSWIAQAITRRQSVKAAVYEAQQTINKNGSSIASYLLDGTPADCATIGIEHLAKPRPNLLFSGINIGTNAGMGFYFNSGTVGAARQAFLHGIGSAAFSVGVPSRFFSAWEKRDTQMLASVQAAITVHARVCAWIADFLVRHDAWVYADLFSVNLPWEITPETKFVLTRLEPQMYAELFVEVAPLTYALKPSESIMQPRTSIGEPASKAPGDLSTVRQGNISITPLCYSDHHEHARAVTSLQALLDTEHPRFQTPNVVPT